MIIKNEKITDKQKQINARRILDLLKIMTGGDDKHEKKSCDLYKGINQLPRS